MTIWRKKFLYRYVQHCRENLFPCAQFTRKYKQYLKRPNNTHNEGYLSMKKISFTIFWLTSRTKPKFLNKPFYKMSVFYTESVSGKLCTQYDRYAGSFFYKVQLHSNNSKQIILQIHSNPDRLYHIM